MISVWKELGVLEQTSNLSTWDVEAARSEVQGHSQLHSELKASLGCGRLCLRKSNKQSHYVSNKRNKTKNTSLRRQRETILD